MGLTKFFFKKIHDNKNNNFKVSLELASHCFELKIVVYFLSEENYLNSTIYNNKFEKTIFLWKTGTHFDVAFDAQKYDVMSFAQNLVYEVFL